MYKFVMYTTYFLISYYIAENDVKEYMAQTDRGKKNTSLIAIHI